MLRGLLALVLSFGLYTVLANIRDSGSQSPPTVALQSPETPAERIAQAPSPGEEATAWLTPSPVLTPAPSATPSAELAAAAPTTVQVLDGGAGRGRTDEAVAALRALGYEIVAVNKAVRTYTVTTIFYSEGQETSAQALRARDQRFAEIDESSDLNQRVALHVVVGTDWR